MLFRSTSSMGNNRLEGTSALPCMCAMADGDPPPEVLPSEQTHTPADQREHALANTLAHGDELRHREQTPPLVGQPPRAPSGSKEVNPTSSAPARMCDQPRHHQQRPYAAPAGVPCGSEHRSSHDPATNTARAARSGPKRPSPLREESGRTCHRPAGGELLVPLPVGCCLMPSWRCKPWWAGAISRTMYPAPTAARHGRCAGPSGDIRSSPVEATDPRPRRS